MSVSRASDSVALAWAGHNCYGVKVLWANCLICLCTRGGLLFLPVSTMRYTCRAISSRNHQQLLPCMPYGPSIRGTR